MSPVESALLSGVGPDETLVNPKHDTDTADDNGNDFGTALSVASNPSPVVHTPKRERSAATSGAKDASSSAQTPAGGAPPPTTVPTSAGSPATSGGGANQSTGPGQGVPATGPGSGAAATTFTGALGTAITPGVGGQGGSADAPGAVDVGDLEVVAAATEAATGAGGLPSSDGSGHATDPSVPTGDASAGLTTSPSDDAGRPSPGTGTVPDPGTAGPTPASSSPASTSPAPTALSAGTPMVSAPGADGRATAVASAAAHPGTGLSSTSTTDTGTSSGSAPLASPLPTTPGGGPAMASPAPTSATTATVPQPPPTPTPAQQVVTVLAPVTSSTDGTHEVTIGLEPEGLGTVKATVTVSAGQVVVQLGTDNDQARDALRQALPLLKHELGGDGSSASVLLSSDGQRGGRGSAPHVATSGGGPESADEVDEAAPATTAVVGPGHGHIDLHL